MRKALLPVLRKAKREKACIVKLDATQQEELERPLLNEECFLILKQCSKNKTPGTDGLSVVFYLRFWSLLGEEMVQSLNYAYEHRQLNITQKQGIIKVIPKKREDKSFLENWRPLSLLNVDYKIATKVIAHRISSVLPIIVNEDQTRYVKGRYISQNNYKANHRHHGGNRTRKYSWFGHFY